MKLFYNGKYLSMEDDDGKIIPCYENDYQIFTIEYLAHHVDQIIIDNSLIEIPSNAFENFKLLKRIDIPDSVTKISSAAFAGCENLEEVHLGKNVSYISHHVFLNCKRLAKINLPEDIYIDPNLFKNCDLLQNNEKIRILRIKSIDVLSAKWLDILGINKYNSEQMQEIMALNPLFYDFALKEDKEVFLDAALDSINKIVFLKETNIHGLYEELIETDICDIEISRTKNDIVAAKLKNSNPIYSGYLQLDDDDTKKVELKIKEYNKEKTIEGER